MSAELGELLIGSACAKYIDIDRDYKEMKLRFSGYTKAGQEH